MDPQFGFEILGEVRPAWWWGVLGYQGCSGLPGAIGRRI